MRPCVEPPDSGTDNQSSNDRRPPWQDAGLSSSRLSQGVATTRIALDSEKSASSAAEGQKEARAGVEGRG